MNKFINWFKLPFKKFTNFRDRASRSEYWYFFLGSLILSTSFAGVDYLLHTNLHDIWGFVSFVPALAVAVRRLHDSNHSGFNLLWLLIPVLGPFYLIWLLTNRSDQGANNYGSLNMSEQKIYNNMFGKEQEVEFDFNRYH